MLYNCSGRLVYIHFILEYFSTDPFYTLQYSIECTIALISLPASSWFLYVIVTIRTYHINLNIILFAIAFFCLLGNLTYLAIVIDGFFVSRSKS